MNEDNNIIENSYLDLQKCGISRNDVDVLFEFGVWKTGLGCPDEILWFQEGTDFVMSAREGEIKVNREENEASGSAYKTTSSGLVEHTRNITLKPSFGSRLYQKFMDIQIRDSQGGFEGGLFQNYSDGGFHMRITISAKDGSYSFREIALNIKLETFLDTFFNDLSNAETEAELSMMIEFSPIYETIGQIPAIFGIPSDLTPIEIVNQGITNSLTDLTITNVELVDSDLVAYNDSIIVSLEDATGTITQEVVQSGSDAVFTQPIVAGEDYKISFGYYISNQHFYNILVENYTTV